MAKAGSINIEIRVDTTPLAALSEKLLALHEAAKPPPMKITGAGGITTAERFGDDEKEV